MRKIQRVGVLITTVVLSAFPFLYTSAQVTDQQLLKAIIKNSGAVLAASPSDIDKARISHSYTNEKTQVQYLYLQQQHQDIKVFNQVITIAVKNNRVVHSAGKFISGMEQKTLRTANTIDAAIAIQKAAEHLGLIINNSPVSVANKFAAEKKIIFSPAGISKRNIETELVWVADKQGPGIRLCWNVNIDVLNSADWWNVRIDAITGEFVEKDNWTVYEKINTIKDPSCNMGVVQRKNISEHKMSPFFPPNVTHAGYYVMKFPLESPLFGNFSTDNEPWLKAGAGDNAITHGWHFDGTLNYITSQGNNVHAYEDRDRDNLPGNYASSSTPAPALTYNLVPDFTIQPFEGNNESVNIINLFYWNNIVHDILYQYGFTEEAGNFQTDNFGRGGLGNDHVNAEAIDGAGVNNANFSAPVDGTNGRMQMFLWSRPPFFTVNAPASIAGEYAAIETPGNFGSRLISTGPVSGHVVFFNDDIEGTTHSACVPAANSLTGKIALVERGSDCLVRNKILKAQDAGAIAVIFINNADNLPSELENLFDADISIPAVLVTLTTGNLLAANIASNIMVSLETSIYADGDIDNGIIAHEYGHGLSRRLTGGPANSSCLNNNETGSEGWSDWLALMVTTDWANALLTDGTKKRPIANYAMGQTLEEGGIRDVPYTTDMTINPATYADVALSGGKVHDMGEPWATALWDMTWEIISQVGYINPNIYDAGGAGGNVIAMNLVIEGMKLQPCNPGFIDARDAILAADNLLYGGAHTCAIWTAFARRGMGYSASQGNPDSYLDQTPAFDTPTPAINLSIPDAFALGSGVLPNTVYIGYSPAASITIVPDVTGGTAPLSYLWSTGATTSSITVSPVVNTTYTLTVTDAAGCKKRSSKLINVVDIRGGKKMDKVMICHNSNTLTVGTADVAAHLAHGDMLGICGSPVTTRSSNDPAMESTGLHIKALPNPSANYFTLVINSENQVHPISLRVIDVMGRVIETREKLKSRQIFNLGSAFSPGMYIIEVRQGEERKQIKIVKTGN